MERSAMDKQEKKRRTRQSSSILTTTSSQGNNKSQPDPIPLDIIFEILSRLPAKLIVRYRTVSKLWCSITTTPEFVNSYAYPCSCVLLTFRKGDMLYFFSSQLDQNNRNDPLSYVGSYQFTKSTNYGYFHWIDCVHGLIILEGPNDFVICNPTMKRFFTLPEPQGSRYSRIFLGYDPIDGKYRALCFLRGSKIGILTLGAQESWRIVSNGSSRHDCTIGCMLCINGVIYYEAYIHVGVDPHRIMSFDFRSEKFHPIKLPEVSSCCLGSHMIVPYEGRLAIINTRYFPSIDIWILKDGDRHEWMHKHFVLPLSEINPRRRKHLRFKGVSDAGVLIFAPPSVSESFYILHFDPRRNSIRETFFEGIVGDEFRCRYGLGKDALFNMYVYPNHIETLVSF